MTEFAIPRKGAKPGQIVAGPDGNLWFTDNDKIGRISQGGAIAEFDPLDANAYAGETAEVDAVTIGPDGNVWFTMTASSGVGYLGVVTSNGDVTNYPFSDATNPLSDSVTLGPDGNLWFVQTKSSSEQNGTLVYSSTVGGMLRSISLPHAGSPLAVAAGPDRYVWVALQGGGVQVNNSSVSEIDRLSTQGNVTEIALPRGLVINDLIAGGDGDLWMTTNQGIGRMSLDGKVVIFPLVNAADPEAGRICGGQNGSFWFTAYYGPALGVVEAAGTITMFNAPSRVYDVATATDSAIWFTEPDAAKIVRFVWR